MTPTRNPLFIALFIAISASLPGCHCDHRTGQVVLIGNKAPTVAITVPVQNVTVPPFDTLNITYIDNDVDDVATTDLVIIRVADNVELKIGNAVAEADGTSHTIGWDTDSGFALDGTYRVEARTSDGHHPVVKHKSPAIITVDTSGKSIAASSFVAEGAPVKGNAVATSAGGSIAFGGSISKSAAASNTTFGKNQTTQTTLTIDGATAGEGIVARYNSNGSLLWARQTTTVAGLATSVTEITAVTILDDESVVCAGSFTAASEGGILRISSGQSDAATLATPPTAGSDQRGGFVACYNSSGRLLWAHLIQVTNGGAAFEAQSLASAGATRGILLSGTCGGTTTFNADTTTPTALNLKNTSQMFVARFEIDGSLTFVKSSEGAPGQLHHGQSLSTFADGSFVVTGARGGPMTLGAGEGRRTKLQTGSAAFLARYNSNGTLAWAKNFTDQIAGTTVVDYGAASASADGTIAYIGVYENRSGQPNALVFGAGEEAETTIPSDGNDSTLVIARFNGDGTLIFARTAGGELVKNQPGARIAGSPDGSFFTTGILNGGATPPLFGAADSTATLLGESYETGAWIARYGSDGKLVKVSDAFKSVASPDPASEEHVTIPAAAHDASVAILPGGDCIVCGTSADANPSPAKPQPFLVRIAK